LVVRTIRFVACGTSPRHQAKPSPRVRHTQTLYLVSSFHPVIPALKNRIIRSGCAHTFWQPVNR
jgi:hypothetical protein